MNTNSLASRRHQTAATLTKSKLDALLVSSPSNIRYLSGFTGSNALLLLTPAGAVLLTDPRYGTQAREQSDCAVKVAKASLVSALGPIAKRKRLKKIGFERVDLSYEAYRTLAAGLGARVALEPTSGIVEAQRTRKSPEEVDIIRRAAQIASKAFVRVAAKVRPGMTEMDLAAELEYRMKRLGAEKAAFETIVASGERSALPHASPTTRRIPPNALVLVDMGARCEGYASDMTRMLFLGRPPRKVRELYEAVLEAQQGALAAIRAGITAGQVDRMARSVLRKRKLEKYFVHSTGHGLGLDIHELPRLGRADKTVLETGMVITVEPGVYVPGYGGIRIEDTVVVTATGCENLTPTSKELLTL